MSTSPPLAPRKAPFIVFAPPAGEAFIALTDDPGRWPLRHVSLEDARHRQVNLLRADGQVEQLDLGASAHVDVLLARIRSDEGLMLMAFRSPDGQQPPGTDDLMPEHVAFIGQGMPLEQIHASATPGSGT